MMTNHELGVVSLLSLLSLIEGVLGAYPDDFPSVLSKGEALSVLVPLRGVLDRLGGMIKVGDE